MKLIGLVPVRNGADVITLCLRALARICDGIVVLDDCSDDQTVRTVEEVANPLRVLSVLRKTVWVRDEPGDRNRLLEEGRRLGGSHFIAIDADEMLTDGWLTSGSLRKRIARLPKGGRLRVRWLNLWRSLDYVRWDESPLGSQYKDAVFHDDGTSRFESEFIHTQRSPGGLDGPDQLADEDDEGLLHFQFVNWGNVLIKQVWYRCLERIRLPNKTAEEINARYRPTCDESDLALRPVPPRWFSPDLLANRATFEAPDKWRIPQIHAWVKEHGVDKFRDLEIWHPEIWPDPDRKIAPLVKKQGQRAKPTQPRSGTTSAVGFLQTSRRLEALTQQCATERSAREAEAHEKEKTLALLREEHLAAQHWQELTRQAEAQVAHLLQALQAERARAEATATLLADAERQRDAESDARMLEAAEKEKAHRLLAEESAAAKRWQELTRQAEAQASQLREALKAEYARTITTAELLSQAEQQRDAERAARLAEVAEKQKALALLREENAAAEHWEQLTREAEAQIQQLRDALAAEHARAIATAELLSQAEQQRDAERAARDQECAVKDRVLRLLAECERQLATERSNRLAEAKAKEDALARAAAAETESASTRGLLATTITEKDALMNDVARLGRQLESLHTAHAQVVAQVQGLESEVVQEKLSARNLAEHAEDLAHQVSAAYACVTRLSYQRQLEKESERYRRRRATVLGLWLHLRDSAARVTRRAYCIVRRKEFVPTTPPAGPRVVQINTHDIIGGAERASYDLHLRFRALGLKPTLIVGGKYGTDEDVFKIPFRDADWKTAHKWRDRWGFTEIFYPTPLLGCFQWEHLRHADVVHIHNMHGQYWSSATLIPLGAQHPVVLTLHDEYTLSGDCCYTYDCDRWTKACGKCPQIKMGLERSARYSLGEQDKTALNVRIKRMIFKAPRAYPLVIITPTDWLATRARRSPNLRHLPIACIHNGVDMEYWKPMDQGVARQALGLPPGRTIGLLVASYLTDRRKGFDIALEAIRRVPKDSNLLFVVVGNFTDELRAQLAGLPVIATGYVSEKIKMLHLFGATDFTFAMSRVDNLPYMCVESLACGRPVFGSAVGGIPEIVNEASLGWLAAQPFDIDAIAKTLNSIACESPAVRRQRWTACRRSAENRFALTLMTQRYLRLYEEMRTSTREGRPVDLTTLAEVTAI